MATAKALYFSGNKLKQFVSGDVLEIATGVKISIADAPSSNTDAANKAYVDSVASGLDVKASCRVATAAVLSTNTRTGNVITKSSNGSINSPGIDGVTDLAVGNRILLKDSADASDNGIYTVSVVGDGGTPWELTRATDANSDAEVTAGMFTFISEGTANAGKGFVLTTVDAITLNTTSLSFSQFSGTGAVTSANSAITVSGNEVTLALATGSGLEISSGLKIASAFAGDGLAITTGVMAVGATDATITVGANGIKVGLATNPGLALTSGRAADGLSLDLTALADYDSGFDVTQLGNDKIAVHDVANSVAKKLSLSMLATRFAGSGLGASSGVLSANVDNSTVEIDTDAIRVKDAGITAAKLAPGAVTAAKIAVSLTAGVTNTQAICPVYLDSSGEVLEVDASVGQMPVGLTLAAMTDTEAVYVCCADGVPVTGIAAGSRNGSFTPGNVVYVSSTGGVLTTVDADVTSSHYYIPVGIATATDALITRFDMPIMKV